MSKSKNCLSKEHYTLVYTSDCGKYSQYIVNKDIIIFNKPYCKPITVNLRDQKPSKYMEYVFNNFFIWLYNCESLLLNAYCEIFSSYHYSKKVKKIYLKRKKWYEELDITVHEINISQSTRIDKKNGCLSYSQDFEIKISCKDNIHKKNNLKIEIFNSFSTQNQYVKMSYLHGKPYFASPDDFNSKFSFLENKYVDTYKRNAQNTHSGDTLQKRPFLHYFSVLSPLLPFYALNNSMFTPPPPPPRLTACKINTYALYFTIFIILKSAFLQVFSSIYSFIFLSSKLVHQHVLTNRKSSLSNFKTNKSNVKNLNFNIRNIHLKTTKLLY